MCDLAGTDLIVSQKPANAFPWFSNSALLEKISSSVLGKTCADGNGQWLVAPVATPSHRGSVAAWAFRPSGTWSDDDTVAWAATAQALGHWYFREPSAAEHNAEIRSRLERAAGLCSRLIHDFGNILTGIMGFTVLAQTRAGTEASLIMYLQEVMRSANLGAEWIHRLQLFCHRGTVPAWPTHLSSLLSAMESRAQTAGSRTRWAIKTPPHLPLIDADTELLRTALSELVNNAREASDDKGIMTVSARECVLNAEECDAILGNLTPGTHVEITVEDDGPGFAPAAYEALFRELFISTKPRHRGIGLLVVYGILQRFRGGLKVHRPEKGKGARIQVLLPLAPLGSAVQPGPKSPHLLLAHADAPMLESLRVVLETRGWRVTTATSSSEALSMYPLLKLPVNLVIADVALPGQSSFDLARRILEQDPKAPFLFLNTRRVVHGLDQDELAKRYTTLRWPMEPADFLQAVERALR